jgi:hypothetical protein
MISVILNVSKEIKGSKAFNHDWTGKNDFKYEIGKIYQIDGGKIKLCEKGFHFCLGGPPEPPNFV